MEIRRIKISNLNCGRCEEKIMRVLKGMVSVCRTNTFLKEIYIEYSCAYSKIVKILENNNFLIEKETNYKVLFLVSGLALFYRKLAILQNLCYFYYFRGGYNYIAATIMLLTEPTTSIFFIFFKILSNYIVCYVKQTNFLSIDNLIDFDAVVVEGSGYFDESNVTGESNLKYKSAGSKIKRNSKIVSGSVKVKRIPTNEKYLFKYTNKTVNYYQYLFYVSFSVFLFQSFVFLFYKPDILFEDDEFIFFVSFKLALNTFTILCPCVLTIAKPLLNLKIGHEMYKKGILVKDLGFLNFDIKKCFIDKTGTLTERLKISNFIIHNSVEDLYSKIFSIERTTNHPVGRALREFCYKSDRIEYFPVKNIKYCEGGGILGFIGNNEIRIGKKEFCLSKEQFKVGSSDLFYKCEIIEIKEDVPVVIKEDSEKEANFNYSNNIFISENSKIIAEFNISYKIRSGAFQLINYLKDNKITPVLLTGDSKENSEKVCSELGIQDFYFNLTSEDKLRFVNKECFIGDGLNDSQALFNAGLGIGLRNKAASVILLEENLSNIIDFLEISKRARKRHKINLFISFLYNLIAFPLVSGLLSPFGVFLSLKVSCFCMFLSFISLLISSITFY